MEWYVVGIIMIGILIMLSLMNIPLAVCLGLTALAFLFFTVGFGRAGEELVSQFFDFWTGYLILAVPLFIFMGEFLFSAGISQDIFEMASKWFRRLPGGLALVTIGACAVFGALTGSSIAAVATFGVVAVPEMLKKGYDRRLATGAVAAAGPLAHLIPPSIMSVLYAMLVETSPGKQLMAGLIPGVLLAAAFGIVAIVWVRLNPSIAPRETGTTWTDRLNSLRKIIIPMILVLVVLGVIYTGIATVTEAAAIGALASMILTLVVKRPSPSAFIETLLRVVRTSSFILLIAVGGKFFGWVLNYYMIPQNIVDAMLSTGLNRWVFMLLIQLLFFVMGMFIDPVGIMFSTIPVLLPILIAFHFDLIWFGVLFLINMEVGFITPPLGFSLYVIKGVVPSEVSMKDIISGGLRFSMGTLGVLALVMVFPQISLWLPARMIS